MENGKAGGQRRMEEKSENPLKSFEEPSKNHRRTIVTSRLQHASSPLTTGSRIAVGKLGTSRPLGV